ncbi:helix-turn-helix domain-containing protein, partial [Klebsiella michiganensis]
YKSELFEKITVLDKKSNTRSILNFFLKKETSGNYHTKYRLSLREKQMLSMLSRGESNQEIAEEFGVKLKTIYTHRRNLMNKLGCKNRITFQKLFFNNKCFFK